MGKILLLIFSFLIIQCVQGQTSIPATSNDTLVVVEQMPEFPGGIPGLMQFLGSTLKYPKEARKAGIKGKVLASFVVDSKGRIQDIYIAKSLGYGCDEEVIRVLKLMPKWMPGVQDGKAVAVRYALPISFSF